MVSTQTVRAVVASYFAAQAVAVASWWVLLWGWPATRVWFVPGGVGESALLAFWLADLVVLVVGSAFAAGAVWRGGSARVPAAWLVAGGAGYAALWCIAASLASSDGWPATVAMTVCGGLSLAMATVIGADPRLEPCGFRVAAGGRRRSGWWTAAQIVVFWGVFLAVLPAAVAAAQDAFGPARFAHPGRRVLAGAVFAAMSALGLWSAVAMVRLGEGTPLPTATAPRLVTRGPYRYVRNPMATAGIGQGLAVGWWLGAWWVVAYALLGGVLWHVAVRPTEEAELRLRFGDAYEAYRRRTPLWWPRRLGLAQPETSKSSTSR